MRLLVAMLLCSSICLAGNYPVKQSANGRYLLDSTGSPFLVIADAPHSIIVNLNSSDTSLYFSNRASNNVNGAWIELLAAQYVGGFGTSPNSGYGKDLAGDNPFTGTVTGSGGYYDFTTPNSAYWTRVDFVLACAATNGIIGILTPADEAGTANNQGFMETALWNGTNGCYSYGQFLGNRYKNQTNIIWNMGNDFFTYTTTTNNQVIKAIADGIWSVDTNHLITLQITAPNDAMADTLFTNRITLNGGYSVNPTYDITYQAYNRSVLNPVVMLEARYEGESAGNEVLRMQEYWAMCAGALAGHVYGDHFIWGFISGWQSNLNTDGIRQLGYFRSFFTSRAWYNLVPDQTNSFLTAGYGTYSATGDSINNDYATAARTTDGTFGVIYTAANHTLTVDMSKMANTVTAKWYDPTTNSFTVISTNLSNTGTHNFTSANNVEGAGDMVLLLESSNPTPDTNPVIRISYP